ncbi:MAG: hypothetical protein JSU05_15395, partial [Bacteroidetes bacterium]|nr:hypothetical protein [Bacteroidota bacterium]
MKISLYAIGVLFFTTINQSCTNSSSSSDNKTDSVKPELKSNTADMPAKDQDLNKIINLALQQSKTIKAKLNKGDIITDMWEPYTGDFTGDNKKDVLIYYDLVPKGGNAIEEQGLLLYENMGSSVRFIKKYVPSYRFSFKKIE